MGGEAAVKVAVRVRPFNGREKAMNAGRGIEMEGNTTYVYEEDVEETEMEPREFAFDYSLWSHFDMANVPGGEDPDHPGRPRVDQEYLYSTVGVVLLDAFWEGFDVCMFAYGQSGAGKSFSMTGTGPKCGSKWKGAIPRICNDTFTRAKEVEEKDPLTKFQVTASMLEIYVGQIYDLLIPAEEYNIKTREVLEMQLDDVKGLGWLPVASEDDVTDLLVLGFGNQTKAPTGLNVDSSRGHTIFTLRMNRIVTNPKAKKKKDRTQTLTTNMKLVDLAGSERTEKVLEITKEQLSGLLFQKYGKQITVSDKMMAVYKAERTTEGRSINNSLTTLGNCVKQVAKLSAIADVAKRKKKMEQIAWRSASLTRLLKSALNGKCKTMMIAAVSPSCTEYPETISTMRYANQIKQIKSTAVAVVAKLTEEQMQDIRIKELEAQLAAALAGMTDGGDGGGGGGGGDGDGASDEEVKKLQKEKEDLEKATAEAKKKQDEMEKKMKKLRDEREAAEKKRKDNPYLIPITPSENATPTPLILDPGSNMAGLAKDAKIPLVGAGLRKEHCTFTVTNGTVVLEGKTGIMVSGKTIKGKLTLNHNDRVRLGENNYYLFVDNKVYEAQEPKQREEAAAQYTWNFCKEEAMQEMLAAFDLADDAEEAKAKFRAEMEAREKEMAENARQHQGDLEKERLEHEMSLKNMKAELAAKSKKAEEELLRQSMNEKERTQKLQEQADRDKEARAALQKQQDEFEAKMLAQQHELEAKLKEQEEFRKDLLKKEEKQRERASNQKAKVQYDLMDAIPQARQATTYAKDLNIEASYSVKVVAEQTVNGLQNVVCVTLTDEETEQTEVWTMDEFRIKFGIIMQEYHDNHETVRNGGEAVLGPDTAFRVSQSANQTIGYAKVLLNFIYFCMELSDDFKIVDYQGKVVGTVNLSLTPLWASATQEEEVEVAENIQDVKSLKFLDLELVITKCTGLPPEQAKNVVCSFQMPDSVSNCLLADEDSNSPETPVQKGGVYTSPVNQAILDKTVVNPEINYKRVLRVHNMTYTVKEWFKTAELIVTIKGEAVAQDKEVVKEKNKGKKKKAGKKGAKKPSALQAATEAKEEAQNELKKLQEEMEAIASGEAPPKKEKKKKGKKSSQKKPDDVDEATQKLVDELKEAKDELKAAKSGVKKDANKAKQLKSKMEEAQKKIEAASKAEKAAAAAVKALEKEKAAVLKAGKQEPATDTADADGEKSEKEKEQEKQELQKKFAELEALPTPTSKGCSVM